MRKIFFFFLIFCLLPLSCLSLGLKAGPFLQNVTPYSATIWWLTDEEDEGRVIYSDGRESLAVQSRLSRYQKVRLTNLKPSTLYTYRLQGNGYSAGPFCFRTAPFESKRFRFAVYGDTRTQDDVHRAIVRAMAKFKPELALHTGDLVADGRDLSQWERFFSIETPLASSCPIYPVLGNHERNSPYHFRYFSLPGRERYYSFNWGDCHFVALDSNEPYISDPTQLKWLEDDLQRNKNARYIIVFFHHPPYTLVKERTSSALKIRKIICPILQRYNVSVVFCGHDHNYQHFYDSGIHYIVTGGGGAPLYDVGTPDRYTLKAEKCYNYLIVDVREDKMDLRAYRLDGSLLEETIVKPRIKVGPPFIEKFPHLQWRKVPGFFKEDR
ncbi:MAG: metallophosphoesterase [bacterium]